MHSYDYEGLPLHPNRFRYGGSLSNFVIIRIKTMNNNTEIIFSDKTVSYDQFVTDLATRIALKIHQVEKGQLEISQAKAFKMFSRADVERWIKNGKLKPCRVSPGKKRFKLIDLQKLANVQQNYIL